MKVMKRRTILGALATAPLAAWPKAMQASMLSPRALRFENLHTGERLVAEYFAQGRYVDDALAAINHLLRDFRSGDVGTIDTGLLDLLHQLHQRAGSGQAFQVISGYRSPATNAALHERSAGVARHSLHLEGRAIDIRLGDVRLADLREGALSLRLGGVGFYPGSNFVHVDTGRVRAW